jgi:ribosomal protein S18 acetylase RimI-like enzyme
MWTHPRYRRRGLAARVLKALEDAAREAGYTRLILETGPRQPEAEALYAGRGYTRIDFYGHYLEARAFSLDLSLGTTRREEVRERRQTERTPPEPRRPEGLVGGPTTVGQRADP